MLLVIGATGATGRELVRQALERQVDVRALVRAHVTTTPLADLPAGVEVVTGDVRDAAALGTALEGVDSVVSLLGARRGDPVGTVRSEGTASLVRAMEAAGVSRLVSVSSVGVGSSVASMSRASRLLWPRIVGADRLAEAGLAEQVIMASGLAWTIVRPPRLLDATGTGRVTVGPELPTGMRSELARADLAALLLDLALDARFTRTAVTAVSAATAETSSAAA